MRMRILIILLFGYVINYSIGANSTISNKNVSLTTRKPSIDLRGKRTLFHYGNYGNRENGNLRQTAQRRTGYAEPRAYYAADTIYSAPSYAYQPNYVPDYSNYLTDYSHQHHHQHQQQQHQPHHYVDAPEPIIEIIIKESNESLAPITPQPYVQKKKKEQVQVFYVNYKKDKHTNKLHLESPIPALTPYGHDHPSQEEGEEEVVHYPAAVTPIPPLKTTTLRTIIHPDSEQYHSNSGIHVTFGTEDKNQYGHQFQEHNEESVLQSVVALPNQNNYIPESSRPSSRYNGNAEQRSIAPTQHPPRSENGQSRNFGNNFSNNNFKGQFQISNNQNVNQYNHPQPQSQSQSQPQQHQQQPQHAQTYVSHTLQLPSSNPSQPFRQVLSHQYQITHVPPPNNHFVHHQQQSQQQQRQQQQQHLHHHNQQPFPPPPQQQHSNNPTQFPTKSAVRFPTQSPVKTNVPFQPPKSRPQPLPSHKPIPIPLQNVQSEHNLQQSPFNRIQPYRPQGHYIFQQPQPQSQPQPHQQQLINDHRFNKPTDTQFRQKSPVIPPRSVHNQQAPPTQHQFNQQPNQQFGPPNAHVHGGLVQQSAPNLGPSQNSGFNSPHQVGNSLSADSEFIKSVSKFEQHITETVGLNQLNQPFGHSQPDVKINQNEFSPSSNNVIHNIPAPQLGPTTQNPSSFDQSSPQSAHFGQFDYNSSLNPQFGNFVTQQPQFGSSTPAPQHYISSTSNQQYQIPSSTASSQYNSDGVNQQVQIVTPVSPTQTQQYNNQQEYVNYNHNSGQPQIIPNSQPHQQHISSKLPPPGHSVSTIHTEALQELEQRRQQNFNSDNSHRNNNGNHPQNYVEISARNKYQPNTNSQTQQQHQQQQQQEQHQQHQQQQYYGSQSSTTSAPSTTPSKSSSNKPSIELPDEVPEELRQQLLSSGILDNADISVLDYDKLGDTALENLPPEHLAHFYGAGGTAQISGSSKILTVVKPNGDKVNHNDKQYYQGDKLKQQFQYHRTLPKKQNVDLKVVRFDSTNQKSVTDKYIRQDSTVLPAVDISDRQYNRYLPLKVSGTQFPIPDVEELKGKKISSVVVLAPVDTLQSIEDTSVDEGGDGRQERDIIDSKQIKFIAGDSLKQLLKKPTKENFKKWLDKEAKTDIDLQSVVLLVAKNPGDEQEIFMYDISTQAVNKLNGALSSAFVNVAEENAGSDDIENANISDSGIVEKMSKSTNRNTRRGGNLNSDINTESTRTRETIIKPISSEKKVNSREVHRVSINSGYSIKTKK